MAEVGDIRRAPDGTFEYLKTQGWSLRGGLTETWWPVATHAAMHMPLPEPYLANLRRAGYEGGPYLHDLLIAEGWTPPRRDYIEMTEGGFLRVERPGELPPRELGGGRCGDEHVFLDGVGEPCQCGEFATFWAWSARAPREIEP